MGLLLC